MAAYHGAQYLSQWGPLLYCSTSYIVFLFVCNSMRAFSGTLHTFAWFSLSDCTIFFYTSLFTSRCKIGIKESLHRLFSYEFLNSSSHYIAKDFLVWHKKEKEFFMILFMNYCVHTRCSTKCNLFPLLDGEVLWGLKRYRLRFFS
jgi:hypothetical protein